MKLNYRPDGRPVAILEVGDLVRLTRAEAGPAPSAQAGEWGRIRRIDAKGALEIELAGYSRPRGAALAQVSDFPATNVIPCDHRGVAVELPRKQEWRRNAASGFGDPKFRL